MRDYRLAKLAYVGYCRAAGGRSLITGGALPEFDDQRRIIQDAWWEAAREVEKKVLKEHSADREPRAGRANAGVSVGVGVVHGE